MRADLEEYTAFIIRYALDSGGEAYSLAEIVPPILWSELGAVAYVTGHTGYEWNRGVPRSDARECRLQLIQDGIHQGAVECVFHRKHPAERPLAACLVEHLLKR